MDQALVVLSQAGPGASLVALIGVAVLAVWRGWLVPRRSVDQLIALQSERLAETRAREQEWRAAWETSEQARAILADHHDDIVEGLRAIEVLVKALPAAASRPGGDDR